MGLSDFLPGRPSSRQANHITNRAWRSALDSRHRLAGELEDAEPPLWERVTGSTSRPKHSAQSRKSSP